jgi:hypothetical protein
VDTGRYKSEAPRPRGPEEQKEKSKETGGREVAGLFVLKANRFGWQEDTELKGRPETG